MILASTFTRLIGLVISGSALLASCGDSTSADTSATSDADSATTTPAPSRAEAALSGTKADTTVSGSIAFEAGSAGKVKMTLQISVPKKANQSVAVHLHEHGDCGDTATHAGGHWNPTGTNHGKWNEGAFHSGDIGNIKLDAQGKATLTVESELWSLAGDSKNNVLDKTVIVHSGVDDYSSQPAGNSGPRIGCGIIKSAGSAPSSMEPSAPH